MSVLVTMALMPVQPLRHHRRRVHRHRFMALATCIALLLALSMKMVH